MEEKGIHIDLSLGITDFNKAIRDAKAEASTLDASLNKINNALKLDPTSINNAKSSFRLLAKDIAKTSETIEVLTNTQKLWEDSGKDITDARYVNLSATITSLSEKLANLNEIQNKFKDLDFNNTEQLREFVQEMSKLGTVQSPQIFKALSDKTLSQGIAEMAKESEELANKLNRVDESIKDTPTSINATIERFKLLTESQKLATEHITKLKAAMDELSQNRGKDVASDGRFQTLTEEISKAEKQLGKFNNELTEMAKQGYTSEQAIDKLMQLLNRDVNFKLNDEGFKRAIENATQSVDALQDRIKTVDSALKLDPGNLDLIKLKFDLLKKAITDNYDKLADLRAAQERLNQDGVDKTSDKYVTLAAKIAEIVNNLKDAEDQQKIFKDAGIDSVDAFDRLTDAEKRALLEALGFGTSGADSVQTFNRSLTAMEVAVGNLAARGIRKLTSEFKELITDSYELGTSFQSALKSLESLYGASATPAAMKQIEKSVTDLSNNSIHSVDTITEAMESLALAGYDVESSLDVINDVLNMATASGEDFNSMSTILVDGLAAFNMGAKQSQRFADALTTAAVSTNTNIQQLGEAFAYAGPIAGTFGYTIEDVAVALGTMASNGIKGSTAGTALRTMMTRLSVNTSHCREAIEALGIQFYDAEGNANSLMSVLDGLREKTKEMSDEDKAELFYKISGQRGLSGLSAIANASDEAWESLKENLKAVQGATERIANTKMDTLAGDVQKLSNNWDSVRREIYDGVEPALRDATQELTKFLKTPDFKAFENAVSRLTKGLVNFGINGIQFASKNITALTAGVKGFSVILGALAIEGMIGKFGRWADMIGRLNKSYDGLGTAMGKLSASVAVLGVAYAGITAANEYAKLQWESANSALLDLDDSVKNVTKSQQAYNETYKDTISDAVGQYNYYEGLIGRLDNMVDATGKVNEGYETQAGLILNELQSAFGIESEMIDGVIQNYEDLKTAAQNAAQEQVKQALIAAETQKAISAQQTKVEATDNLKELLKQREEFDTELKNFFDNYGSEMSMDYYSSFWETIFGKDTKGFADWMQLTDEQKDEAIVKHRDVISSINSDFQKENEMLASGINESTQQIISSTDDYNSAMENLATADKSYEEMMATYEGKGYQFIDVMTATREDLKKAYEEAESDIDFAEYMKKQLPSDADLSEWDAQIATAESKIEEIKKRLTELSDLGTDTEGTAAGGAGGGNVSFKVSATVDGFDEMFSALGQFKEETTEIKDTIGPEGTEIASAFGTNLSQGFSELIPDAVSTLVEMLREAGTESIDGMSQAVVEGEGTLSDAVASTTESATNANMLTPDVGANIGANFIDGIINGLWSKSQELYDAAFAIAGMVDSASRSALDINSPSKLGEEVGQFWDMGIEGGLNSRIRQVERSAQNVANAIYSTTQSALNSMRVNTNNMLTADKLATAGGGTTNNYFTLDTSNVKELNDLITAADNAQRFNRMKKGDGNGTKRRN